MDKKTKFNIWYVLVAFWGVLILHGLWVQALQVQQIPYSQFQTYLTEKRVEAVRIGSNHIEGTLRDPKEGEPKQFITVRVEPDFAEKLVVRLGGRGAEELVYSEVSTGAQDDLQKATDIAKNMIKTYGMSERLGQVSFEGDRQPLFLSAGRTQGGGEYSEATAREIDNEVRRIIDEQYTRVKRLLADRLQELRKAAAVLLVKETITGEELQAILTNAPHQRSSMNNDNSNHSCSSTLMQGVGAHGRAPLLL